MIAVDANVLVRVLVDDADAGEQCRQARALVQKAKKVRIAWVVFVETVWVLASAYDVGKAKLVAVVRQVLDHPRYQVENGESLRAAVELYAATAIDFSDAVALTDARACAASLHTFDRRLARCAGATLVE